MTSDATKPVSPAPSTAKPRRRRRWLFRLLAIGVPLLPLVVGEVLTRRWGYGGYPPVLKALGVADGRTYYGSNQAGLSTFFFQNLTVVGSMEEQVFISPKPPGTIRVFILGESAARGFPQPRSLAASSFFQAMLQDLKPDHRIEVINLGTTAIASFPVMHILDEALRFDPDLVIVYCGNNEFFGAHGVASVHAFGRSTAAMKAFRFFRSFGLGQWITDVATRRGPSSDGEKRDRTLMEQVIADAQIGPDDPRRAAAAENLERHISYMVHRCRDRGVPAIVCTLPANERDLAPIGAEAPPPLAPEAAARWGALLAEGRRLTTEDRPAALAALEKAAGLYDRSAALQFAMGQCLTALGRDDDARVCYAQARDLDPMPWRAPSALNDAVRRVAGTGGELCDVQAAFAARSPGGAIGWELMDDHVHPNLAGQALIAVLWLEVMTRMHELLRVDAAVIANVWMSGAPAELNGSAFPTVAAVPDRRDGGPTGRLPPWQDYAARLGDNFYDRYGVAHRMISLLRAPFYRANNEEALQRFEHICADYEALMPPAALEAARRWQDPNVHQGGHRPITGMVGQALMAAGDDEEADRLLTIARRNVPTYSVWALECTWDALKCRARLHPAATRADLALAREMVDSGETLMKVTGTKPPAVRRYVGLAYSRLGEHGPAIAHLGEAVNFVKTIDDFEVVEALALSLVKTGQRDKARRLLTMPVRDPALAEACGQLLMRIDTP